MTNLTTHPARSRTVEQNVLGSLLLDNGQWARVQPLGERHFAGADHKLIFRAIGALIANSNAADLLTVEEHLRRGGELEHAGGLSYLSSLARETANAANAATYAEVLRSDFARRELVALGAELTKDDVPPDVAVARAQARLTAVKTASAPTLPAEALTLLRGSDVKMQPTDWLWQNWLATACLQVFAGPAGLGKTTIALSLAAVVTRARLWPDGTRCARPGSVIFWSGEDAVDKTLMPRFVAMGGDPERIYFVDAVAVRADGRLETREFDPSRDIPLLIEAANELGDVRLLVVDPVSMCVAGDSNKNAEVRRGLAPLKVFAERHGAAVLGISHFSKGSEGRDPLSRVTGSLAFGAAPRLVLSAVTEARKPDEPEDSEPRHLFVRTKSNLGPCGDGFRYSVEQATAGGNISASRIVWGEHLKGGARELLADAEQIEQSEDYGAKADAQKFLAEILAGGPVESKAVLAEARQAGHSPRTLDRAKSALRVHAIRDGSSRPARWLWQLPEQGRQPQSQERQPQNFGVLGALGALNGNSSSYVGYAEGPETKNAKAAISASPEALGGLDDRETF